MKEMNQHGPMNHLVRSLLNLRIMFLQGALTNMQEPVWSKLWKIKVPNKMKMFLWIALHDKVLRNVERKRRGLTSDGDCDACHSREETAAHILRDCCHAKETWMTMVGRDRW